MRSNEESKPPLSPTIILVGFDRRETSAKEVGKEVAGAEAARRRGSKQKARLSAASSVVSAFAAATSLEEALGAEAIAHKPFVAPLNKRFFVGRAEPIQLF